MHIESWILDIFLHYKGTVLVKIWLANDVFDVFKIAAHINTDTTVGVFPRFYDPKVFFYPQLRQPPSSNLW